MNMAGQVVKTRSASIKLMLLMHVWMSDGGNKKKTESEDRRRLVEKKKGGARKKNGRAGR